MISTRSFVILFYFSFNTRLIGSSPFSYNDILPVDYNREIPPTLDGQPVIVNVSMIVLSLKPDLNAQMSFNIDFMYHLYWYDHRLTVSADKKTRLGPHWKDKLWLPDIYFRNAISGGIPQLFHQNFYFTVSNDNIVFMAARIQLKLNCEMDFTKFPFDRQIAFINITTLSQTIEDVSLYWERFRIGKHVELPEYEITDWYYDRCTRYYAGIGGFSCLFVSIDLKRNIGKYILKRFIPSALIVIMSFIGFWLPTQVVPARVALIITALLALIAQQITGEINISYIYALEVFTIICIVFVFATLIELAIAVCYPLKKPVPTQNNIFKSNSKLTKLLIFIQPNERNCSIDVISRTIFPIVFIIVMTTYALYFYFLDEEE